MKKILAVIGTLLTTLCVFIWSQLIAPSATEAIKANVKPILIEIFNNQLKDSGILKNNLDDKKVAEDLITENITDLNCKNGESEQQCKDRILEEPGANQLKKDLDIINAQYEKCHQDVQRLNIDLVNDELVYRTKIKCMIVNNQGERLDNLAKSEPYLANTIYQVKRSIFPAYNGH